MKNMMEIKSELGFTAGDEKLIADLSKIPWPRKSIVKQHNTYVVYNDGYPVTDGHLLFVPRSRNILFISDCFIEAYKTGVIGVENGDWDSFNVGMNFGTEAGQTIDWPHVHMIPRRKGDMEDPRGGVRHVIPDRGNYRNESTYWASKINE